MEARIRSSFEEMTSLQQISVVCSQRWPDPTTFPLTRTFLNKPTLKILKLLSPFRRDHMIQHLALSWRNEPLARGRVHLVWPSGSIVVSSQPAISSTTEADSRPLATVSPFWKPFEFASREERISIWHRIISFTFLKAGHDDHFWDTSSAWFSPHGIDIQVVKQTLMVSRELYVR